MMMVLSRPNYSNSDVGRTCRPPYRRDLRHQVQQRIIEGGHESRIDDAQGQVRPPTCPFDDVGSVFRRSTSGAADSSARQRGVEKGNKLPWSAAVLQGQMLSQIVRHQVRVRPGRGRANRTDGVMRGVRVLERHMIFQGGVRKSQLSAVRTGEGGGHVGGGEGLSTVVQLEVRLGQDALHGVVSGVVDAERSIFVACRAKVVVVTYQALEALAAEVACEASVAIDAIVHTHLRTFRRRQRCVKHQHQSRQGRH